MDNNNNIKTQNENQDNSQEIFNLIQSIQSKLNTNNNSENNENKQVEFEETLKYTKEKNIDNNSNNSSNKPNLNSILQNVDLGSIIKLFSNNSNEKENSNNFNFDSIDPNTILRIKKVMNTMSKEDPQKNLLLSLKPFLRKSRQDKIGEYMSMLTIAKAIEIFTSKGSDDNV